MFKELFFKYYKNWDFKWEWLKYTKEEEAITCECNN